MNLMEFDQFNVNESESKFDNNADCVLRHNT